jgi:hypothetical protein
MLDRALNEFFTARCRPEDLVKLVEHVFRDGDMYAERHLLPDGITCIRFRRVGTQVLAISCQLAADAMIQSKIGS